MALPELTPPAGLPCFLAAGHAIEVLPVFAHVEATTGHLRKRRVWTTAPRVQSVGWLLEASQMAAVHKWYRDDLLVGSRHFSARVMPEGGTPMWWEALWVEPFTASAMARGRWRVAGRLRLLGAPSLDGPVRTSFVATLRVGVTGSAAVDVTRRMRAVVEVSAGGSALPAAPPRLSATLSIGLT